jgi:ABC-2 type transport system permease protein
MNPRILFATTGRVLLQLRHDRRTMALLILAPVVIMSLLRWMFASTQVVFDVWGPVLLGVFPLIIMFLVTSVATLRERSGGTLERLLALPMGKLDFLLGYGIAFGLAATVQAAVVAAVAFGLLGLHVAGPVLAVVLVAVLVAILGSSMGLLLSAFASTEFQAVQFMPALLIPQLLVSGLFGDRSSLPDILRWVGDVLPMTYAVDAVHVLQAGTTLTGGFARDVVVLVAFIVGFLGLGAVTLRRRTP